MVIMWRAYYSQVSRAVGFSIGYIRAISILWRVWGITALGFYFEWSNSLDELIDFGSKLIADGSYENVIAQN